MIRSALNQLAKGAMIYGLGGVLQRFMGLLLLPFLTEVLTPGDYGIVALIALIGATMTGLLTLGTGNSMGVLYYLETDFSKRPFIIWTNLVLITVNGLFWYGVVFLSAPILSVWMFQTDRYTDLIRIAFLGTVAVTVNDPWLSYLRMEGKARKYVLLTLISSLTNILLTALLVLFLHHGLLGFVLASVLSQALMLFMSALVVGRHLPFGINFKLFSPLVRIGFPSIFGLFAFLLLSYADRQLIERLAGLSALGIYSLGSSFGIVIMVAISAFSIAWPPFYMSYITKQNEAKVIFGKVLTYYVIGFGSLVVLFFFMAKPVTLLITSPDFHEAWKVVGLVAAAYALKGCYLIMQVGICFAQKFRLTSTIDWIAALVNIGLNLYLIEIFGIVGAAIAMFASYLIMPVMAWFVARRYLAVDYDWWRVGLSSSVIWVASTLLFYISGESERVKPYYIYMNALVFIAFLGVAFKFLLTSSERDFIKRKLRV